MTKGGAAAKVPRKKPDKVEYEDGKLYSLEAGTPIYVKTADICRMTGKSNQWIGQLTSQGVLTKEKTKYGSLYELSAAMLAYCHMLEERAEDDGGEISELTLKKLKAELKMKEYKARLLRLEADEREGTLHRSEDVEKMTSDLIFTIRQSLLALPGRVSTEAAALTKPAEVSELIRSEIYKIMDDLSSYRYNSEKYAERVKDRNGGDAEFEEE